MNIVTQVTLLVNKKLYKGEEMATDKKRIATYVTEETVNKFRVVAASKGKSMSEYTAILKEKAIEGYEVENGKIKIEN